MSYQPALPWTLLELLGPLSFCHRNVGLQQFQRFFICELWAKQCPTRTEGSLRPSCVHFLSCAAEKFPLWTSGSILLDSTSSDYAIIDQETFSMNFNDTTWTNCIEYDVIMKMWPSLHNLWLNFPQTLSIWPWICRCSCTFQWLYIGGWIILKPAFSFYIWILKRQWIKFWLLFCQFIVWTILFIAWMT